MTDKTDLIREIHEYVTTHGGENTATHLLVQAASAIQTQAAELEAVGDGEEYEVECISHSQGNTAPQPTPAPLSEMPCEKRKAIQEGEQIGASDAWFKARHEMLDTVDRRNVFRAGFDRGWNAAIAAQGGKDA